MIGLPRGHFYGGLISRGITQLSHCLRAKPLSGDSIELGYPLFFCFYRDDEELIAGKLELLRWMLARLFAIMSGMANVVDIRGFYDFAYIIRQ